jgi:hypothetical protein
MKFNFFIKILIILIIPLSIIQPVKADLASDLLKLAGEVSAKNKVELAKWGLKSSKDIKKLKSKEIKSLISGKALEGTYNDNQKKGKTVEVYYKDGTYRGSVLGKSESAKWYVKEGKLCYKEFNSCAKVYKSKSEPIVYYLKQQGIIYTKFTKVSSLEELEKIKKAAKEKKLAEEKAAKEKKLAEEKAAKEKKLAEEKAAKEKKLAEEKAAKAKLEKKLSLLPLETDLKKGQNFLNYVQDFIKLYPEEFEIVKLSELLIATRPIMDGSLDAQLKNDLELLKEFTGVSNKFTKYINEIENSENNKKLIKIDEAILNLEKNTKIIKRFLVDNPNSIQLEEWLNNLKIAEKLLDELNSYDQLITTNQNLVKLIDTKKELDEAKISINSNISKLKEYLKINLTSDLAPSIIEQIKLLEEVLKKENLKDINSSNEIAKEFIYIKFVEPEEKRIEEERIAEEQKRIAEEQKRIAEIKEKIAEEKRIEEERNPVYPEKQFNLL